jgi:hypothetical protein
VPLRRRPAETNCLASDTTASAGRLRPAMQASRGPRNSRDRETVRGPAPESSRTPGVRCSSNPCVSGMLRAPDLSEMHTYFEALYLAVGSELSNIIQ